MFIMLYRSAWPTGPAAARIHIVITNAAGDITAAAAMAMCDDGLLQRSSQHETELHVAL